jgi:UrcA family protein
MKAILATTFILAAFAAGAAKAQSTEEIRIPVSGLSKAALNTEINRAAHRLCDTVTFDILSRTSSDTCIADAVARAKAQVKALEATGAYVTANNQR